MPHRCAAASSPPHSVLRRWPSVSIVDPSSESGVEIAALETNPPFPTSMRCEIPDRVRSIVTAILMHRNKERIESVDEHDEPHQTLHGCRRAAGIAGFVARPRLGAEPRRSEEHTSELQSQSN